MLSHRPHLFCLALLTAILGFAFALASTGHGQVTPSTGDYQWLRWNGTDFVEVFFSPGAHTIQTFDGSGVPSTLALSSLQTVSGLNGFMADPGTHGTFSATAWRDDLGLAALYQPLSDTLTTLSPLTLSSAGLALLEHPTTAHHFLLWNGTTYTDVPATTGDLVGTTDPQILSSKTINGSNNSLFVRINGDVTGLGTGVATFLSSPTSANLRSALTDEVGTGAAYFIGGALGTPASATLTNATGLPIATGVSGLGNNVATFLATPSSANLALAVTGETGTAGALVFSVSPTFEGTTYIRTTTGQQTYLSLGNASFADELIIESNGSIIGTGRRAITIRAGGMEGGALVWAGGNSGLTIYSNYNIGVKMLEGSGNAPTNIYSQPTQSLAFLAGGSPLVTLNENWGLNLNYIATSPTAYAAAWNCFLYSKSVSGSSELHTMDGAGNETVLSPHAEDAPAFLYDQDDYGPDRVVREANYYTGVIRWTNESRRARLFERLLNGEDLDQIPALARQIVYKETFADFKERTGITLERLDWEETQSKAVVRRQEDIAKYEAAKLDHDARQAAKPAELRAEYPAQKPETVTAPPKPAWLEAIKPTAAEEEHPE